MIITITGLILSFIIGVLIAYALLIGLIIVYQKMIILFMKRLEKNSLVNPFLSSDTKETQLEKKHNGKKK